MMDSVDIRSLFGAWLLTVFCFAAVPIPPAQSAVFGPVADGDVTALIDAIEAANDETTNPGPDTIVLANNGTYTLSPTADNRIPFIITDFNSSGHNGLPAISSDITIEGNGSLIERDPSLFSDPADPCSSAADTDKFRIFDVRQNGDLTIDSLTIQNGCADDVVPSGISDDEGGGIFSMGGLTIVNSALRNGKATQRGGGVNGRAGSIVVEGGTFEGNHALAGGGVSIIAISAVMTDCLVRDNTADLVGGGVAKVAGTLTMTRCTISGNRVVSPSGRGGGLETDSGGTTNLIDSAVYGNTSANNGGGIAGNDGPTINITNTTVSDNTAADLGGGIALLPFVPKANLKNSTVSDNSAGSGGGIYVDSSATATLTNTIVADQAGGGDCFNDGGVLTSNDFNLDSDNSCNLLQVNDKPSGNANLGPLQVNAPGSTVTHALLDESDAIDMGDCSGATIVADQRGVPRPQDGDNDGTADCDIGAFERLAGSGVIGDFVWQDLDGDGAQEANEPGKPDVTVELVDCSTGEVQFSTTTDADGLYRFENLTSGNYQVKFTAPAGFGFSPRVAAGDWMIDSNPDPATGLDLCRFLAEGQTRLALDAGLIAQAQGTARIGDRVWEDLDGDGVQDAGEPGLSGVTVRLLDCGNNELTSTTTGAAGDYVFPGLAAGQYRIGFVAPLGFNFSPANQGPGGQDSNANPATGLTGCLTMAEGQSRLGIDAGLSISGGGSGEIGDFVWNDLNGDGIQDDNEPGLENVSLELQDCNGNSLASTTSDANGVYAFANIPPGSYKIHFAEPSGFVLSPRQQGTMRGKDSNPFPNTGLSQCLSMTAGQIRLGIDAGMVAVSGFLAPVNH